MASKSKARKTAEALLAAGFTVTQVHEPDASIGKEGSVDVAVNGVANPITLFAGKGPFQVLSPVGDELVAAFAGGSFGTVDELVSALTAFEKNLEASEEKISVSIPSLAYTALMAYPESALGGVAAQVKDFGRGARVILNGSRTDLEDLLPLFDAIYADRNGHGTEVYNQRWYAKPAAERIRAALK